MRGRVIQSSGPLRYAILEGMDVRDTRVHNYPPRWNGAPSQDLLVIRRNHETSVVSLDPLRWGLIPYWCQDPKGGRKPINAKCETVATLPTFRDAYRRRRCIVPVDGFFEWKAVKGQKAKQPYAIAMKDGSPFGLGGLWENWKDPTSGEWLRTFAIITTDANELVAEIHDRMPLILGPADYNRWLSDEPDPHDLMRPSQPSPCGCGRYRRGSTSRRMMNRRNSTTPDGISGGCTVRIIPQCCSLSAAARDLLAPVYGWFTDGFDTQCDDFICLRGGS
jgi:putative SOS response-associated peptidase YedK